MTIEFSQFVNAGVAAEGDIIVGLAGGVNAKFTFPSVTGGTTWNLVSSNTTMMANNGYIVASMGTVTLALPTVIAMGQLFEVTMLGTGSFVVQCAAGQQIRVGNAITSVAGYFASNPTNAQGDAVRILACSTTQLIVLSGVTQDFNLV